MHISRAYKPQHIRQVRSLLYAYGISRNLDEALGNYFEELSMLPQKYGLLPSMGKDVTILPGNGFGTILPGETTTLLVTFEPPSASEHKYVDLRTYSYAI